MVDLKTLIKISPFPDERKKELLEKADTFSAEKKFELESMCWEFIFLDYQNKLQYAIEKAMLESAKGEKKYTKEDFKKMEDEAFEELVNKFGEAGTDVKLEQIREKIQTHLPTQSSSPTPVRDEKLVN